MERTDLVNIAFTPGNHLSSFNAFDAAHSVHRLGFLDLAGGLEIVSAILTLLYIGSLLYQGHPFRTPFDVAGTVIKTSLRGQQIARKLR